MKRSKKPKRLKLPEGYRFVCKCECGGNVIGSGPDGLCGSYCDRCTPVETVIVGRDPVTGRQTFKSETTK